VQRRRGLAAARPAGDPRWGPLRGAQQLLVALAAPLEDRAVLDVRAVLLAHGGWVSSYLPDSALLGIGGAAAARALCRVPGMLWVVRPGLVPNALQMLDSACAAVRLLRLSGPLLWCWARTDGWRWCTTRATRPVHSSAPVPGGRAALPAPRQGN